MDNPRLLTEVEWAAACADMPGGSRCVDCRIALCKAQDKKTATIVQAATLRAVGEWLLTRENNGPWLHIPIQDIEALRNGQWPAGWEKGR